MISDIYRAQVDLENLSRMPAVQWKLLNIQKLIKQNPDKHAKQLKALEDRLAE
jgi:hypothetical protein